MRAFGISAAATLAVLFGAGCPPTLSATASSISVSPATVTADGAAVATITVTVLSDGNQPVSGKLVVVTATGTGNTLTQPAAVTDANGVATATLVSTFAEAKTITATADGTPLNTSATAAFVAGPPTKLLWAVQPIGTVVSGTTFAPSPQVQLYDAQNNPAILSTAAVTLAITPSTGSIGAMLGGTLTVAAVAGVATFSDLSIDRVGTGYTLTASSGTATTAVSSAITVVPGPISASASIVALSAGPVVANGTTVYTVSIHVVDAATNPLPGKSVDIADTTGTANTVTTATTDVNGDAQVTIRSTKAESKTIKVTVDRAGANVLLTTQPSALFIPGPVSTSVSTVIAVPASPTTITADGAASSTVTVTLLDANSNPIAGKTVDLADTSGTNNTVAPASIATDVAGQAVFALRSTKAEPKSVKATVDRATTPVLLNQQPAVVFAPGAPHLGIGYSSVVVTPFAGPNVIANIVDYANVVVTVVDAYLNPISGLSIDLSQTTGMGNTFSVPSQTTNGSGQASFTIMSTKAEPKNVVARINSSSLLLQQPAVNFVPGPVDLAVSTVTATPQTGPNVVADGTDFANVLVTVVDAYMNPIVGQSIDLTQTTGTSNTFTPSTPVNTDSAGHASFTIKSIKAETKTVKGRVGGTSIITGSQPAVTFVPGPVHQTTSSAVANPVSGVVANGSTTSTITVTARDFNGNLIQGASVTVGPEGPGDTITPVSPTTDASGIATFTIRSTKAGLKTLTATVGTTVLDATPTVTFDPGSLDVNVSTVVVSPAFPIGVVANDLNTAQVTVTLVDAFSNPIPNLSVDLATSIGSNNHFSPSGATNTDSLGQVVFQLSSPNAELKTIKARVSGVITLPQQPDVQFVPGPVSLAASTAVRLFSAVPVTADGIDSATYLVTVTDAQSNPIQGASVMVVSSNGNGNDTISPADTQNSGMNGAAQFQLRSIEAETKTLTFFIDGQQLTQLSVQFVAGPPDPAQSSFTAVNTNAGGNPKKIRADSETATLTLTALDQFDNPCTGLTATFTSTGGGNTFAPAAAGPTSPAGIYTATLSSTEEADKRFTATVGSMTLTAHLKFIYPADVTGIAAGPQDGSCVQVNYTLHSTKPGSSIRTDVLLEVDPLNTNTWLRAEMGQGGQGVYGLAAFAGPGAPHQLVWNSLSMFPFTGSANSKIRVTAIRDGVAGISQEVTKPINNGMRFGPFASAAAPGAFVARQVDVNRDGKQDVVALGASVFTVAIGDGVGGLLSGPPTPTLPGGSTKDMVVGDFNDDGIPDVAILADATIFQAVSMHLGLPGGGFGAPSTNMVNPQPVRMVSGDFNRDGHLDIVTLHGTAITGQINVLLNDGAGGFLPASGMPLTLNNTVNDLEVGDFNRDGKLDLVVSQNTPAMVTVLLNNGAGVFSPLINMGVSPALDFPSELGVADLNRDGKLDLIVSGGGTPGLISMLGLGNGDFAGTVSAPVNLTAPPSPMAVADFDGDGIVDVVRPNGGSLIMGRGVGDGTFMLQGTVPTGPTTSMTVGDLESDGVPDLITTNFAADVVGRQMNTTNRKCKTVGGLPGQVRLGSGPSTASRGAIGDFDLDGWLDLVTAGDTGQLSVLRGNGTGFALRSPPMTVTVAPLQQNLVAVGDVDGDLDEDLFIINQSSTTIQIATNTPGGFFTPPGIPFPAAGIVGQPKPVDLNGDPFTDFAAPTSQGGVVLFRDVGPGMYTSTTFQLGAPGDAIDDLAFGDWNDDGLLDVAGVASNTQHVFIAYNDGLGSFTVPQVINGAFPWASIAAGDFDHDLDGDLDLAVTTADGQQQLVYINDIGDFPTAAAVQSAPSLGGGVNLAAADVDGDGWLDLTFGGLGGQFGWRRNSGFGALFDAAQPVFLPAGSSWAGPVDIDGDRRADFAVVGKTTVGAQSLALLYPSYNGGLFDANRMDPVVAVNDVGIADVNRDGILDAVAVFDPGQAQVYTGDGFMNFAETATVSGNPAMKKMLLADLNRDGIDDLVVANLPGGTAISIALGDGAGSFGPFSASQVVLGAVNDMVSGDFNHDGAVDVAIGTTLGLSFLYGDGAGGLGAPSVFAGNNFAGLAAGDVDRNGFTDLVVIYELAPSLWQLASVRNNGGALGFAGPAWAVAGSPSDMVVNDLDLDGKPDLVVATGADVRVYQGDGAFGFTEAQVAYSGFAVSAVGVLEPDRSGGGSSVCQRCKRILSLDENADRFSVLIPDESNFGLLNFTEVVGFHTARPSSFALGDLNRDAISDGVVTSRQAHTVTFAQTR